MKSLLLDGDTIYLYVCASGGVYQLRCCHVTRYPRERKVTLIDNYNYYLGPVEEEIIFIFWICLSPPSCHLRPQSPLKCFFIKVGIAFYFILLIFLFFKLKFKVSIASNGFHYWISQCNCNVNIIILPHSLLPHVHYITGPYTLPHTCLSLVSHL